MSKLFVYAAALSVLAACGRPSANADKGTFQTALQAYYDTHPICVTIPLTFPVDLSRNGDAATKQQLNPLVAAGLISVAMIQKNEPTISGKGKPADYVRYAPTADGEKVIRKAANDFLGGTDICFARRRVVNVESFTEPAESAGIKLTRVTYAYELKDIERWATRADIALAFPQIGALLAKPTNEATDGLVLTNVGWKHEGDLH